MSAASIKKSLRIFPKKGNVNEKNALDICHKLINNCRHLEQQLQYRIDFQDNYIEVLFTAIDGEHYLDMDFEKYHFWELAGTSNGRPDWVKLITDKINTPGETAFYSFNKIEFIGNQSTLMNFYKDIYEFNLENQISRAFKNPQKNKVEINVKGIYTANTESETGKEETRIPQRKDQFELLEEFEKYDYSEIETIMFEEKGFFLKEFFLDEIGRVGSTVAKTNDLEEVIFYHNNKKTRTYQWIDNSPEKVDKHRYGYWKCNYADWWENCINPGWVTFFDRMKRPLFSIFVIFLLLSSCSNHEVHSNSENTFDSNKKEFELSYTYTGIGSGMGKIDPRLKIIGNKYLKTMQQNSSWTGEYDQKIDTICQGIIDLKAIKAIKEITDNISPSKIYENNPKVLSGGIFNIRISYDQKEISFSLKNISHPKAKEIIDIVNSTLPEECGEIFLWEEIDNCNL